MVSDLLNGIIISFFKCVSGNLYGPPAIYDRREYYLQWLFGLNQAMCSSINVLDVYMSVAKILKTVISFPKAANYLADFLDKKINII